jgi:hypothetical protein
MRDDDEDQELDRNGEPAELDWGCITLVAMLLASAIVTALVIVVGTRP